MTGFESLGENVELGCVQRACGAEPLGIFRFTASKIENVCHALETGLDHLFTGDDLEVFADYGDGRFHCRSRYYDDFIYYVYLTTKQMSMAEVEDRERKKVVYLRRRLLEDLNTGDKIFVRKGSDALGDLRRLHRALKAYGSPTLLVVSIADVDHPAGTVERLEGGLLRGFVAGFKVCNRPEPIDVGGWLRLCRAAHRMTHGNASYVLPRRLDGGSSWQVAETSAAIPFRSSARTAVLRDRTASLVVDRSRHEGQVVARQSVMLAELEPRDMVVFSAWVHIPAGFADCRLFVGFDGLETKHEHPFDARRPNQWQRIWSSIQVPRGRERVTAEVRIEGMSREPVSLGEWAFEKGAAPSIAASSLRGRLAAWWLARRSRPQFANGAAQGSTSVSCCARAERLIAGGAFVEADDLLSIALAAAPDDAALGKIYAISAHNSGRYFAAVARWERALVLNTSDPMCFAGFAGNLREHLSIARAKDVIGSALAFFPDDMMVLTEAARIANAAEDWAEASRLWDKAIALHGSHPEWEVGRDHARRRMVDVAD